MRILNSVKEQILLCEMCELSSSCRTPIPVHAPLSPRFLVLGEAPGKLEDIKGEPFVGPAGMFLKRSLRKAGLMAADGGFLNAVCCFPAKDRTPDSHHIAACSNNLFDQLDLYPAVPTLVCGSVALKAVLPHAEIAWASGAPLLVHQRILFPVYHPAYILRSRMMMDSWEKQLRLFSDMVVNRLPYTWDKIDRTHCLYCSAGYLPNSYTCPRHVTTWAKDSVRPKRSLPPHPSLF